MKLKTSALAMTATLAAGLISSAFADTATVTPYEKLVFKTNLTYTVTVSGSTKTDSKGEWSGSSLIVADDAVEFDTDANAASTFTPKKDNSTCNATELKFNVSAAIVPKTVDLAIDSDAQCGFAIKATESNGNRFMVYTGSSPAWQDAGLCELTADTSFELTVKIDYRTSVAQYVVTKDDQSSTLGNQWYPLAGSDRTSVNAIDFIGNGKLTSLRGDKLEIISEVIVVNPGSGDVNIVVPETALADIRAVGKDPTIFLNDQTPGTNDKLTNLDRLAITGKLEDPEVANLPKTVAKPFDAGENKLAIKLDNLAESLPKIEGATPTFTLQGSNDKNDELAWADIKSNNDGKAFEFNAATYNYKYYRVKATVVYGSAQ